MLPARLVRLALFGATATVCLMAASVGNTTERAWVFALANAAIRLILLVLWGFRAKRDSWSIARTFLYNGIPALIWIGSAATPAPYNFGLWAVAILLEILLLRQDSVQTATTSRVDLGHVTERLGLFMMILVGESLLSIVTSLSAHWSIDSLLAALLGFVAIAFIAWNFFVTGVNGFEMGLRQLSGRRDGAGMLATVMVLPYLIAVSITMLAAGLATVVENPGKPLPLASAICLDGGLALYFIATGMIVLRYGGALRSVLLWLALGAALPLLAIVTIRWVDSLVSILIVAVITILSLTITLLLHERSRAKVPTE